MMTGCGGQLDSALSAVREHTPVIVLRPSMTVTRAIVALVRARSTMAALDGAHPGLPRGGIAVVVILVAASAGRISAGYLLDGVAVVAVVGIRAVVAIVGVVTAGVIVGHGESL